MVYHPWNIALKGMLSCSTHTLIWSSTTPIRMSDQWKEMVPVVYIVVMQDIADGTVMGLCLLSSTHCWRNRCCMGGYYWGSLG